MQAVASVAGNVATGGTAKPFPAIERHPWLWLAGATALAAEASLLAWWAQRRYEQSLAALVPAVQKPPKWVVERPVEVDQVVTAVRKGRAGPVGMTTAVHGAGGFGKTTLVKMVRADPRVLRRFRGRVYWVTLGRDASSVGVVEKVNDLIRRVDPVNA